MKKKKNGTKGPSIGFGEDVWVRQKAHVLGMKEEGNGCTGVQGMMYIRASQDWFTSVDEGAKVVGGDPRGQKVGFAI